MGESTGRETGLRHEAAQGGRWMLGAFLATHGTRLAFTLVLARVLGPQDFAVVALALLFLTLAALVIDQGWGAALIQSPTLTDELVGTIRILSLAVAAGVGLAVLAGAGLIADFFRVPALDSVLRVLVISVLLQGVMIAPKALLKRTLKIRQLAGREMAAATVGTALGISAVALGAGYWSVVVQSVATDLLLVTMIGALAGSLPAKWSQVAFRAVGEFTSKVFAGQLLSYIARNGDNLLIGRILGPLDLSFYSVAYRSMLVPVQGVTYATNNVGLPVLARMQGDSERFRRAFLDTLQVLASVTVPLMAISIVAAPSAVPLILGTEWKPAVVPLQILAITGMRQGITAILSPGLLALGRADLNLRFQAVNAVVSLGAFLIGLPWGIVGVAAAYSAAGVLVISPMCLYLIAKTAGLRPVEVLHVLFPTFACAAVLVVSWLGCELGLATTGMPAGSQLAACSLIGVFAYLGAFRVAWPDQFSHMRDHAHMLSGGFRHKA